MQVALLKALCCIILDLPVSSPLNYHDQNFAEKIVVSIPTTCTLSSDWQFIGFFLCKKCKNLHLQVFFTVKSLLIL